MHLHCTGVQLGDNWHSWYVLFWHFMGIFYCILIDLICFERHVPSATIVVTSLNMDSLVYSTANWRALAWHGQYNYWLWTSDEISPNAQMMKNKCVTTETFVAVTDNCNCIAHIWLSLLQADVHLRLRLAMFRQLRLSFCLFIQLYLKLSGQSMFLWPVRRTMCALITSR